MEKKGETKQGEVTQVDIMVVINGRVGRVAISERAKLTILKLIQELNGELPFEEAPEEIQFK